MSGQTAYTSTNRFQVTDQGKLREILSKCRVAGDGARPPALDSPDDGGLVAFHCPGSIEGYPIPRDEEDDCSLTGFLHDISGILAPGQACIITEARHGRMFVVIEEEKIPGYVKEAADRISVRQGRCN